MPGLQAEAIQAVSKMSSDKENLKSQVKEFYGIEHKLNTAGEYVPIEDPNRPAERVVVKSLDALVDLIKAERDTTFRNALVNVLHPGKVVVISPATNFRGDRITLAEAIPFQQPEHILSDVQSPKKSPALMISLLTQFVQNDETKELASIVSGMKFDENEQSGESMTEKDFSYRNKVHSITGDIPEVVVLTPHLTFPEVDQPAIMFVLKTQGVSRGGVSCELIQGGGDTWKTLVANRIKSYLSYKLEKETKEFGVTVI